MLDAGMGGNEDLTLYATVAHWLTDRIETGVYAVGARVPSIRSLSGLLEVSIGTVREAYELLERRGYLECRPQSGYFVRRRPPEEPETKGDDPFTLNPREVVFCSLYAELISRGASARAANLAIATPDMALLPTRKIASLACDVVRRNSDRMLDYSMSPGLRSLREGIARLSLEAGIEVHPDDIVITNGCTEAIALALNAVCSPGDTIAVESPLYFNFFQSIASLRLKVVEIPSSPREGMNLDVLEFALKHHAIRACLAIPTYSNPNGSLMSDGNKRRLVAMLSARGVPLIEDDIYGDLSRTARRPPACKAFDADGTVLYCSSFSKTLGPGLRLGWAIPGRYRDGFNRLKSLFSIGNASLDQMIGARFLEDGGYERHLRLLRAALAKRVVESRALIASAFPAGTRVSDPPGGFLLWVQLPGDLDAGALYARAIREELLFPPGSLFSLGGDYRSFLRLNGSAMGSAVDQALVRLGELAAEPGMRG